MNDLSLLEINTSHLLTGVNLKGDSLAFHGIYLDQILTAKLNRPHQSFFAVARNGLCHEFKETIRSKRLYDIAKRAELKGLLLRLMRGKVCNNDNPLCRIKPSNLTYEFDPIHPWHTEIGNKQVIIA